MNYIKTLYEYATDGVEERFWFRLNGTEVIGTSGDGVVTVRCPAEDAETDFSVDEYGRDDLEPAIQRWLSDFDV